MTTILIVDDESQMRKLLTLYLKQYDFLIKEATDGIEALAILNRENIHLVILDVMMPNMDGWETLERIRMFSDTPILMLTAKGNTEDKVIGLSTGADDYLVKPFEEAELVARIQALLRRSQKNREEEEILKINDMLINLTSREAFYQDKMIKLTHTEFDLLHLLMKNRGKVFTREQLIEYIWGIEFNGEDRTIDSHIKNLREKLRSVGVDELIKTVWGVGYKIQ